MTRVRKSLPSYRKHKPTGQAVVTLSGHDHYLGLHGTRVSRDEYDRLVALWLAGGRQPLIQSSEVSVAELLIRYLRHAKTYYRKDGRPTSELAGIKSALRPLKQLYARTPAREFGPLDLKALRERFIGDRLARGTVNKYVSHIKRVFRWGASEQLVPEAVYVALTTVDGLRRHKSAAAETVGVGPVDDADVIATLPHLPDVVADMVRIQRATGMRPGEVCQIRPCDIDRTGDVWFYCPESHKTQHHGKRRLVPLGPKAQTVMLRYLARDSEDYCFQPRDSEAKRRALQHQERKTPLSCGTRPGTNVKRHPKRSAGRCYSTASYRRAISRACEKAKLNPWSPNQLRHTAATEIRQRFGVEAAQVVLGHAQADVTQIYAERDYQKAVEVARAVG